MVAKKRASAGKKLKVKKETLKDLDVKSGAKGVKGGAIYVARGTVDCRAIHTKIWP